MALKGEVVGNPLKVIAGSEDRPLVVGEIILPVYVLEGGVRVLSIRGFRESLEFGKNIGGPFLADFMGKIASKLNKGNDLTVPPFSVIPFIPPHGGKVSHGIEASKLIDFCDLMLEARDAEVLTKRQEQLAARCGVLIRAFAKTGIIALIDETTGFQEVRPKTDLQQLMERFLSEELRPWAKKFPNEYYEQIFRLHGWTFDPASKYRPKHIGKLTRILIYDRLPLGIIKEIDKRNPPKYAGGVREFQNHRFLSETEGDAALRNQINICTAMMRAALSWDDFLQNYDRAYPLPRKKLSRSQLAALHAEFYRCIRRLSSKFCEAVEETASHDAISSPDNSPSPETRQTPRG